MHTKTHEVKEKSFPLFQTENISDAENDVHTKNSVLISIE